MRNEEATTIQKIIASLLGLVILVLVVHFFYHRALTSQYMPSDREMLSKMEKVEKN